MKNVIVLTGSVRPNNVSDKVAQVVADRLSQREEVEAQVVKVGDLNLPFFDGPVAPSDPTFAPTDENVLAWTKRVAEADAVVLVMPEYNHAISAVQKNAIDWVYKEWQDKPVLPVAYGWYAGSNVLYSTERLFSLLKFRLAAPVGLTFKKELEVDGTVIDEAALNAALDASFDELLA